MIHIRGEDDMEFDVNEEDWPTAELAIRSSYEGALIDGLPAGKRNAADEEIRSCILGSGRKTYLLENRSCSSVKHNG